MLFQNPAGPEASKLSPGKAQNLAELESLPHPPTGLTPSCSPSQGLTYPDFTVPTAHLGSQLSLSPSAEQPGSPSPSIISLLVPDPPLQEPSLPLRLGGGISPPRPAPFGFPLSCWGGGAGGRCYTQRTEGGEDQS